MTTHPVTAKAIPGSMQAAKSADARVLADFDVGTGNAALWCRRTAPDPRSTISAMWASSLVWAAENLADMFSTTVKNVQRRP